MAQTQMNSGLYAVGDKVCTCNLSTSGVCGGEITRAYFMGGWFYDVVIDGSSYTLFDVEENLIGGAMPTVGAPVIYPPNPASPRKNYNAFTLPPGGIVDPEFGTDVKTVKPASGDVFCGHDWKKYVGIIDTYDFCTKCDGKRPLE